MLKVIVHKVMNKSSVFKCTHYKIRWLRRKTQIKSFNAYLLNALIVSVQYIKIVIRVDPKNIRKPAIYSPGKECIKGKLTDTPNFLLSKPSNTT